GLDESGDATYQRRLASAARPDHRAKIASVDQKTDTLENFGSGAGVSHREVLDVENRHGVRASLQSISSLRGGQRPPRRIQRSALLLLFFLRRTQIPDNVVVFRFHRYEFYRVQV